MKIFIATILIILLFFFSACEKKVEGCMNPRASNFNAEADEDLGCSYYTLMLKMQHFADKLPNDTLATGNWIYDANAEPFYLTTMSILYSNMRFIKKGDGTALKSPALITLYSIEGEPIEVEDNFFITKPKNYGHDIAGWADLGTFDSLSFHVGIPWNLRKIDRNRVEKFHPLSTTPLANMYDNDSESYKSIKMTVRQPLAGVTHTFLFDDYVPISMPCNVTVVDGLDTPVRMRLDYEVLFEGISFTNDGDSLVKEKLLQNITQAYSPW